jgi:hypothetical protein
MKLRNRQNSILFVALFFLSVIVSSCYANVDINKNSSVTIVTSKQPSKTEQFAAEQLQHYIHEMIGVRFPIANDSVDVNGFVMAIGKNKYSYKYDKRFNKSLISTGSDSFVISIRKDVAILVGGADRGTIYSVYEFLEQQGCRWFYPGRLGEVVPQKKKLIFEIGKKFYEPDFVQRSIDGGAVKGLDFEETIDWSVKNRINWRFGFRDYFIRRELPKEKWDAWSKRGGMLSWEWICHNFNHMLPNDKYYDDHPEYYSLYKGERLKLNTGGQGGGNLCTTNPDVIHICAEYIINWFDKNPDGQVVPLWPADGTVKWCECENCSKLGGVNFMPGEKGSMSRRMVVFANAVARLVYPKYPDRYILCPAYSNYIEPVPDVHLEKNILLQICIHGCYCHGVNKCEKNKVYLDKLEAWSKPAKGRIGIWEYFLIGDYANEEITPVIMPVNYRIRDTVKKLHDLDFTFYFTQTRLQYWKHNPLAYYLLSKLIWDADADFDILWDDFFEKMYGPAATSMNKFYRLIENTAEESNWHPQMYSDITAPSVQVFTKKIVAQLEDYLSQAEQTEIPVVSERVQIVREAFDSVKANVATQELSGLDENLPWRLERNINNYIINVDGKEISGERYAETIRYAKDTGAYDSNFKRTLFRSQKREVPVLTMENDSISIGVVPAIGGRIIRLIDKKNGRNYFKESVGKDTLDTISQSYFYYGGYEEYIGSLFAGPGWEKEFSYRILEEDGVRSLILTLEVPGYVLKRTISLEEGDNPEIMVTSILTNTSKKEQDIKLRVHPLINLGENVGENTVYLRLQDGSFKQSSVDSENGNISIQPAGMWVATNSKLNIGIANYFSEQEAYCYICKTGEDHFTMELMGQSKTLGYRESLRIKHVYRVISDVKAELDQILKIGKPRIDIKNAVDKSFRVAVPKSGKIDFKKGKIGGSASFLNCKGLDFNSKFLKANAGSIEMWIKSAQSPGETENQFILGTGNNNPEWFVCAIGTGRITFLQNCGQKPYNIQGHFYYNLSTEIPNWQADQWHHLAFVWANQGRNESVMQIYVDGKLKEGRYNISLGNQFEYPLLNIGYSAINAKKSFTGEIDELRISNYPKSNLEISTAYEMTQKGTPLTEEEGTLLMLHFDDDSTGTSATSDNIDMALVQDLVKIIHESSN